MSTKASLAYGNDFHLYEEVFDDERIHLSLSNVEFEASKDGVSVAIPLHIWECIRQFSNARFNLVKYSHEMVLEMVAKKVDQRIKSYMENGEKPTEAVFGCIIFGLASESRDYQIQQGMSFYLEERERQRSIKAKLDELLPENGRS